MFKNMQKLLVSSTRMDGASPITAPAVLLHRPRIFVIDKTRSKRHEDMFRNKLEDSSGRPKKKIKASKKKMA
jgi:hypothetical protein